MWRFIWFSPLVALATPAFAADSADAEYLKEVEIWRSKLDADIRAEGWLETVGREKVREGNLVPGFELLCRHRSAAAGSCARWQPDSPR